MQQDYSAYMNPTTRFFSISHIYTKTTQKQNESGVFSGVEPEYTLYQAKIEDEYPPIIILAKDLWWNPKDLQASLQPLLKEDHPERLIDTLPTKSEEKILKALNENCVFIATKDDEGKKKEKIDLVTPLLQHSLLMKPIPRLRKIDVLEDIDWGQFISKLLSWDSPNKDPRLNLAHKAFLLKGVNPRANPHGIICTNAGTGKSIHFQIHAINYDKVKKNSFLGFAKSPTEIFKGTVDGTELPANIDQIEVGEWGILDYMFNIMERGEALISSGSVNIPIKSKSPFCFAANSLDSRLDTEKGFGLLLSHLTANPAIGRRFGIIIYGNDYNVIDTRSSEESMNQWKTASSFFRAVEEYAKDELDKIYQTSEIWVYLNREIEGYKEQVHQLTRGIENQTVRTFIMEHGGSGQIRLRAAALSASIVEHLDIIALKRYTVTELITYAEETLSEFVQLNLQSIRNMIKSLDEEEQFFANSWIKTAPDYMKEIIYAVEVQRRKGILGQSFMINGIEYKPSIETYTHISQCVQKLLKRKSGMTVYEDSCRRLFGFLIKPRGKDLEIILLNSEPMRFLDLPVLPDLPIYPIGESDTVGSNIDTCTTVEEKDSTSIQLSTQKVDKVSQTSGKRVNGVNRVNASNVNKKIIEDSVAVMRKEESCGLMLFIDKMTKLGYNSRQVIEEVKKDPRFKVTENSITLLDERDQSTPSKPAETLSDALKNLVDFIGRSDSVKDDAVLSHLKDRGYSVTYSVKLLQTAVRDGTIFSPRPGFYRRSQ